MMTTVLPTPAPPKRPIFPPFRKGWMRSMTLMPVSNISSRVDCSSKSRRLAMDGHALVLADGAEVVDGLAEDVEHAAERLAAHGNA